MLKPLGYSAYNNGSLHVNRNNPLAEPSSDVNQKEGQKTLALTPGRSLKFVPAASREEVLRSKFDEKVLKKMGVIPCETCASRVYQDGSNDPGVSFKAPTHIAPEASAALVSAHEQEHVSNEQTKAEQEDREVISQSVQIFHDVCPECGKHYVSGGLTKTTTAAKQNQPTDSYLGNLLDLSL